MIWPAGLLPGLLSLRWPAWVARSYASGRQVDGKRVYPRTFARSVPEWKTPFQTGNN